MSLIGTYLPEADRARYAAVLEQGGYTPILGKMRRSHAEACWYQATTYRTAAGITDTNGPRIRALLAELESRRLE